MLLVYHTNVASESFKWDDLSAAIASQQIATISPVVLKYNQNFKKGETLDDYIPTVVDKKTKRRKKIAFDFEKDEVPLYSAKNLRNIYDEGALANLKNIFFPKPI